MFRDKLQQGRHVIEGKERDDPRNTPREPGACEDKKCDDYSGITACHETVIPWGRNVVHLQPKAEEERMEAWRHHGPVQASPERGPAHARPKAKGQKKFHVRVVERRELRSMMGS